MRNLESSLHLFQAPRYYNKNLGGKGNFDAVRTESASLSLDASAITAILAYNYATGNRTLFSEIERLPWLSREAEGGETIIETIPPHGVKWAESSEIANKLFDMLLHEAEVACEGRSEIYVLLSGGLDSRIVAGIIGHLYKSGKLLCKPTGVTWGIENSRDVQYAKNIAAILGFGWHHISISPSNLLDNIRDGFPLIAGLVSPMHLHAMNWFKNASNDALVLAGSYGDSIGRAEFSGRHLLELESLHVTNPFGLISQNTIGGAVRGIGEDIAALRQRSNPGTPKHALCEHQMQGFYMRGMIGHVMSIINEYCTLYQMFTSPEVYGFMWSLHPARRDDTIYAALLENFLPDLARLPWARTNRALSGKTIGSDPELTKEFHNYSEWCSGPLYPSIDSMVEPDWFASTGIFDPKALSKLIEAVGPKSTSLRHLGNRPYDILLWLAGFKLFCEKENLKGKIEVHEHEHGHDETFSGVPVDSRTRIRRVLSSNPWLYKNVARVRRSMYKKKSMRMFPPEPGI